MQEMTSLNESRDLHVSGMNGTMTTQLVSDATREMFILVNHVVLSTSICLMGIVVNILNICVFVKQGLKRSTNSSFFAMAVSDLCGVLTQVWHNFCLDPYVDRLHLPVDFMDVQYLTAGWPNSCLVRITGWITVYITAERCLSIALPLKIKQIVTPRRTACVLVFIYAINIASILPLYFSAYFSWNFYPLYNTTKLGISFRPNKLEIESLIFIFQASLAITAFISVIIFTSVLVVKLKKKSKWRQKSTFDKDQTESMSNRERRTVSLIILVATVLIVCYSPAVVCSITTTLYPAFSITGPQSNLFHIAWSFGFLCHSINSSVTIFLYYSMSSKYRATFNQLFPLCACSSAADSDESSVQRTSESGVGSVQSVVSSVQSARI
ncbi:probable G-protein coupled receptor B0563.6 [Physella acuta]|uniref:probable G-protein coupled receptor B0563.6 n=1 Tax=Physella acuta TaxID=109671 RepID=UPI0027DD2C61|nr:probable G-protein coupled receptor B0563.6 [Physella acuta]